MIVVSRPSPRLQCLRGCLWVSRLRSVQLVFELPDPMPCLFHLRLQVRIRVLPAGHETAVVVEGFLVPAEGVEGLGAAAEDRCEEDLFPGDARARTGPKEQPSNGHEDRSRQATPGSTVRQNPRPPALRPSSRRSLFRPYDRNARPGTAA